MPHKKITPPPPPQKKTLPIAGGFQAASIFRGFCLGIGVLLVLMALLNEYLTNTPLAEANAAATRNYAFTDMSLRNAEVVQAMGMMLDCCSAGVATATSCSTVKVSPATARQPPPASSGSCGCEPESY